MNAVKFGREIERRPLRRLEALLRWMEAVELSEEMRHLLQESIEDLRDVTLSLLAGGGLPVGLDQTPAVSWRDNAEPDLPHHCAAAVSGSPAAAEEHAAVCLEIDAAEPVRVWAPLPALVEECSRPETGLHGDRSGSWSFPDLRRERVRVPAELGEYLEVGDGLDGQEGVTPTGRRIGTALPFSDDSDAELLPLLQALPSAGPDLLIEEGDRDDHDETAEISALVAHTVTLLLDG